MVNEIKNIHIKKLIQAILTFEAESINNDNCNNKMSEQSQSAKKRDKEMVNSFVLGFDKLVADIGSKRLPNQQSKCQ